MNGESARPCLLTQTKAQTIKVNERTPRVPRKSEKDITSHYGKPARLGLKAFYHSCINYIAHAASDGLCV